MRRMHSLGSGGIEVCPRSFVRVSVMLQCANAGVQHERLLYLKRAVMESGEDSEKEGG